MGKWHSGDRLGDKLNTCFLRNKVLALNFVSVLLRLQISIDTQAFFIQQDLAGSLFLPPCTKELLDDTPCFFGHVCVCMYVCNIVCMYMYVGASISTLMQHSKQSTSG